MCIRIKKKTLALPRSQTVEKVGQPQADNKNKGFPLRESCHHKVTDEVLLKKYILLKTATNCGL